MIRLTARPPAATTTASAATASATRVGRPLDMEPPRTSGGSSTTRRTVSATRGHVRARGAIERDERGDATPTERQGDARVRPVQDRGLEIVDFGPVIIDGFDRHVLLRAITHDREAWRWPVRRRQEGVVDHEGGRAPDDLDPLAIRGGEPALEMGEQSARKAK